MVTELLSQISYTWLQTKNCTIRSRVTTLLHPIWNSKIQWLKYKTSWSVEISCWSSFELVCKQLQKLSFIFLQSDWLLTLPRLSRSWCDSWVKARCRWVLIRLQGSPMISKWMQLSVLKVFPMLCRLIFKPQHQIVQCLRFKLNPRLGGFVSSSRRREQWKVNTPRS